jgi:hypothetical protein
MLVLLKLVLVLLRMTLRSVAVNLGALLSI